MKGERSKAEEHVVSELRAGVVGHRYPWSHAKSKLKSDFVNLKVAKLFKSGGNLRNIT